MERTKKNSKVLSSKSKPQKTLAKALVKAEAKVIKKEGKMVARKIVAKAEPKGRSDEIAMSIACPGQYVYRWASQFSVKKTGIAVPFSVTKANWGQVTTDVQVELANTETIGFAFRCLPCAAILYDQNSQLFRSFYRAHLVGQDGLVPATSLTALDCLPAMETPLDIPYFTSEPSSVVSGPGAWSPHGPVLYSGVIREQAGSFIWLDKGDELKVHLKAPLAGQNFSYICHYYGPNGLSRNFFNNVIVVGTTVSAFTLKSIGDAAGYYTISLQNNMAARVTLNTVFVTLENKGSSSFRHLAAQDFSANAAKVDGYRVLADSLMYSNTSPAIDLGGTIAGYQSGSDDHWLQYANNGSVLTTVSSKSGAVTRNASKGMYGFMKFTEPSDFDFKDQFEYSASGVLVDSSYSIDERGSFLAIAVSVPDPAGCAGYWTTYQEVEFLTDDVWTEVRTCDFSVAEFNDALEKLKGMEQFYENPVHLKDIWNGIKSAGKFAINAIRDYGPTVLSLAKML